jgi:hypothetical protein
MLQPAEHCITRSTLIRTELCCQIATQSPCCIIDFGEQFTIRIGVDSEYGVAFTDPTELPSTFVGCNVVIHCFIAQSGGIADVPQKSALFFASKRSVAKAYQSIVDPQCTLSACAIESEIKHFGCVEKWLQVSDVGDVAVVEHGCHGKKIEFP